MADARPVDALALAESALALETPPSGPLVIHAQAAPSSVRLSLVIPTYNEGQNVKSLVLRLEELLDPVLGDAYELIVVDDDSPDRTWELALALRDRHPRLRVLRRIGEKGLSTAVIRGWQIARGDVLGVMDADLQHPPEVNVGLWSEMERGADLAAGSRHVEGGGVSDWSFARRVLSRGAQLLGLLILPGVLSRLTDPMSGFFMVKREAIASVRLSPIGYKILVEVVARGKIRWIGEVGYVFRERVEGESKVTWRLYLHYLEHLLRLRLDTLKDSRFFRFCVVGATGVLVDMGLLYLLSDPSMLHLGLTRSKIIAAETAMAGNFLFNDAWTFRDVAERQPGWIPKLRRFIGFQLVCSSGLLLNVLLLNVLFNFAGLNRYWANGVSIGMVTFWNYGLNRFLNWAPITTKTS
jgi:dolichol-phosphate mannosyltransferase